MPDQPTVNDGIGLSGGTGTPFGQRPTDGRNSPDGNQSGCLHSFHLVPCVNHFQSFRGVAIFGVKRECFV